MAETLVPVAWLTGELITLADAELEQPKFVTDPGWQELKAKATESSDRISYFESPPETWKKRRGRAGYALVRNGVIIHYIITAMN